MLLLCCLVAALVGYLLGSINSAILTVRLLKHEDVRNFGSGNAGLTNTLRCFGKGCAALTLIGDLAKGVVAVLISRYLTDLWMQGTGDTYFIGCLAGCFAILGHVFPIYHHFKGGKGVLVGVSIFLVLDWRVFCILIGIFAVVLLLSKYVSLASVIAASCCPFVTAVVQYLLDTHYTMPQIILHFCMTAVMAGMVVFMHRSNIQRLKEGTERKITDKKERRS